MRPRAWSVAIRAEQPVPVGERSILPGRTTTALAPVSTPFSEVNGPANWQKEIWRQLAFSGWTKPNCLFAAAVDLDLRLPDPASSPDQLGARLARHFIAIWEGETAKDALLVLLRSAATYPAAAQRLRAVFLEQVLAMVRRATGNAEDADVRAGLIASQVLGTALCRYVLALPPVVAMDAQALAAVLGPQLQRCLTGPLNA